MDTADGRAFRARWARVRQAERDELAATPIEVKLQQLAALMASAHALGWDAALAVEDELVWQRWQALRAARRG